MYYPCVRCYNGYNPKCDTTCDYARAVKELKLLQEELYHPANTLGELAIRCCEMLGCENCPVHIHNFDKRTDYEKQMLHIPCIVNLYKWIIEQAKNSNEFEGM